MRTFLECVAHDIISKYGTDLSRTVIVFPNKRASLFMNEYLAKIAGKPIWSPLYTTISDMFTNHSKLQHGDCIKLICDLHKSFMECTGTSESFDHFYGWGQILLSDFDDIDKNMADADKVFANVKDIHELDDISYLDESQINILKKFFANFSEEKNTELKQRFLSLWSNLSAIYHNYNDRLNNQGLAYEGALYRKVVNDKTVVFKGERYIFVGFNVLQKVEQELFTRLKNEGKAKFYWDFDNYYMPKDKKHSNEAGHYIASYLEMFPNELDISDEGVYGQMLINKNITFVSASTESIQARYMSKWLKEPRRIEAGKKTAVVMCNEGLLQTIIHSIPDGTGNVNITTGYPLHQSPFSSLLNILISLQTSGYIPTGDKFRLRQVNAILKHPYMKYISPEYIRLYNRINVDAKLYHPNLSDLNMDEGTQMLFHICGHETDKNLSASICKWIIDIIRIIAYNAKDVDEPLFQECLFNTYTLMNRLLSLMISGDLHIEVSTLQKLITQLVMSVSIPFHGEPAIGIQIMGVLETRNLDFKNLLILSCNEGNMPKGVNDTSFIPYSIRKAYGLTTVEHKVAIYSYYFHRLIQRAENVTIAYNNSTENGNRGEMSRFMMQIMVESGLNIKNIKLHSALQPGNSVPGPIEKTTEVMERLTGRFDKTLRTGGNNPLLTPTAINRYMRCQLQFYYRYVCGLSETDNDEEEIMDNRMFGNIFHDSAQILYEGIMRDNYIYREDIENLLRSKTAIPRVVDEVFREQVFKLGKGNGGKPEYNGLQLINREVIITYLRKLLETDAGLAPFEILGLEVPVISDFDIAQGNKIIHTTIGGRIDRLDIVEDDSGRRRIRVVDYKTGSREVRKMNDINAVFDISKVKEHNDYFLQTLLYSVIVSESADINPQKYDVSPSLLYIQHVSGDDYDPTLSFGKDRITDIRPFAKQFDELLHDTVNGIFNPSLPFTPTEDKDICSTCPYMKLCRQ
ncbi:PD-(D/E)XK nuclease family protein [Xylanibacter muris]|uniref:PD-(D/E)XK nuclease family protein n=1 Tax=Xylanibacter muris TaxID=2736290 RepID=A0ABX2ANG6_9BACT|nr:PD-(D/E)XK nuclease family protein [Xylanibacter muris]NPD92748.1 PD-(D/E)XK nuclease family protein [Xylanibacter muris]